MRNSLFLVLAVCVGLTCAPAAAQEATAETESTPPPGAALSGFSWVERPSAEDFYRHYPRRAMRHGIQGRVILDCLIGDDGRLTCMAASEAPADNGFGDAAIAIARNFRAPSQLADGRPTAGGRVQLPISFLLH